MKKSILIIFAITVSVWITGTIIVSCESERVKESQKITPPQELDNDSRYYTRQYEVYTLEGCEYIVVGAGSLRWGSHKGNCKSPIHIKNEEVHTAN